MSNFIKTQDEYTKKTLLDMGFVLLHQDSGMYTFVNTKQILTFDDSNMKVVFSNNISF